LVEIATNGLVAEYGGNNGSFSPDNQLLQISGNSVNRIIDLQSQETLFDFPGCMALRRTPNGQSLICHTYNRLAVVIDFDTGIRSDPINAYWVIDLVMSVNFCKNGRRELPLLNEKSEWRPRHECKNSTESEVTARIA
jgi:hypothetical protein